MTNGEPTFVFEGVTGTIILTKPGPGIALLVVQLTVLPVVVQPKPLLVKVGGAVVPAGNATVTVSGAPVAG